MTTSPTPRSPRTRRIVAAISSVLLVVSVAAIVGSRVTVTEMSAAGIVPDNLQHIEVRTRDFAFDMPASLRAGLTQVTLINDGPEPHHLWIVKLEGGKTLSDLFQLLSRSIVFPSWARSVGGPNAPVPGGRAVALMDLEPGHYAALCVIPSVDGTPHFMKGMAREFEVTGVARNVELAVDIEATLSDYDFQFSKPLTAGRQVIRFTNNSPQVHEAFIARLEPGKTAEDLLHWWIKQDTPPPAIPLGGITGIEPGSSISIVQDFEPGTYAFYCFVADSKDGREHIEHGMMKEFTIASR
jgi:uncharacterized cupredoxin-like copper-binding protein